MELTILSFGAGQDSTTLLYKYIYDSEFRQRYAPGRFLVICSDTGDEHPETYKHIEQIKQLCVRHKVEFVHLTPDMGYHRGNWQSLRGFYRAKTTCGSKAYPKTCTDNLKLQPIYRYVEDWLGRVYGIATGRKRGFIEFAQRHGKIKMLLGIARGEEGRVADPAKIKERWRQQSITAVYPLIDLGLDRQGCQDYISSVGHSVPPPSNCILCPFMSEIELVWLYRFQRRDYKDWVKIERRKMEKHKALGDKNFVVWGRRTLPHVLAKALERFDYLTDEQLQDYKMSHGHCVKSKY